MKSISILLIITATASAIPTLKPHVRRQNQIIPVVVGGPQDTFVPNSVVAAVGDIVQFQFSNGNHTVTQSTIDQACTPMASGVHSGHIPFQDGQTDVGTFNMPVTSTDPMFLYCATGPHCQEGQVMVINAANAKQVADYAKLSQTTEKSTDGTDVVGGTAGKIALDQAAFTPAPPEDAAGGPPPPAAPPAAEAPAGGNSTAPAETTAAAESPAASTSAASSSAASAETSAAASTAAPAETSAAAKEPAAAGEPAASTPTVDLAAPAKASPTSFVFLA